MITEPTLFIERKGVDGFEVDNALKIIMATNEAWAIPAGIDERRFAVFEVSNEFRQRNDYFKAPYAEIENGGAAAMMHDLLALDLQGWHPREGIPQTGALREQKLRSLPPEDEWWITILEQGWLPGTYASDPAHAPAKSLYKHARRTVPRLRYHKTKPSNRPRLSAPSRRPFNPSARSCGPGDPDQGDVCDLLEQRLKDDRFNVVNRGCRIFFPSHGRQADFHREFGAALHSAGLAGSDAWQSRRR
jgi:hypothetical protein